MRTTIHTFCLLLLMTALTSCGATPEENTDTLDLHNARILWAKNGSDNYQITLTSTCFCVPSSTVTHIVVNNKEVTEAYTLEGAFLNAEDKWYTSVEDLFDLIESTLMTDGAEVSVTYDETYGFPTSVYLDYNVGLADEEDSFTLTNYTTHAEARETLQNNKTQWEANNISDYTVKVSINCFCEPLGNLTVTVTDGVTTAIVNESGESMELSKVSSFPINIGELFDFLNSHYQNAASDITVEYDNGLHYPTNVSVNSHPLLADDTINIQMNILQP